MKRSVLALVLITVFSSVASGAWTATPGSQKVYLRKKSTQTIIPTSVLQRWGALVVDDQPTYMVVQVVGQRAQGFLSEAGAYSDFVRIREDFDIIDFRSFPIDSRQPAPTYPAPWSLPDPVAAQGRDVFVIQFASVPRQDWVDKIRSSDSAILGYLPQNGYLVLGNYQRLQRLAAELPVQVLRRAQPIQKVDPELRTAPQAFAAVSILVADVPEAADASSAIDRIRSDEIHPPEDRGTYLIHAVVLPAAALPAIAARPAVIWLEPYHEPTPTGEREAHLIAGDSLVTGNAEGLTLRPAPLNYKQWLKDKGIANYADGSAVGVALLDTGFDIGSTSNVHSDFKRDDGSSFITSLTNYTQDGQPAGSFNADCYGHGTMVAGILAGNARTGTRDIGSQYSDFDYLMGLGVAPALPLTIGRVFCYLTADTGCPAAMQERKDIYYDLSHNKGVRLTNNSWNNGSNAYDTEASLSDQLVRAAGTNGTGTILGEPMAIYFSGGNADDAVPNSVRSPATAKNVIAVGGSESYNPIPGQQVPVNPPYPDPPFNSSNNGHTGAHNSGFHSDDGQDLWELSGAGALGGTGNAGRVKPDIVAPASAVPAPKTRDPQSGCSVTPVGSVIDAGSATDKHYWSRGTSFASPAAAGAGALLYTWFKNRAGGASPKPSLLKAMQINFAYDMRGDDEQATPTPLSHPPNNRQGWGKADLTRAFATDGRYDYVNESTILQPSSSTVTYPPSGTYSAKDASRPVRITLVWTDRFGLGLVNRVLVNNLDLKVVFTNGNYAVGNSFDTATGHSIVHTAGGAAMDDDNNVEQVVFSPTDPGVTSQFTVQVIPTGIIADALNVWTSEVQDQQDFSLFIDNVPGGVTSGLDTPAPSGLTATYQSGLGVALTWTGVATPGASYNVYRREHAADMFPSSPLVSGLASPSYIDATVAADKTYGYEVVAVIGGVFSPATNVDIATTVVFTDPSPGFGASVKVKGAHITQLRTAVDKVRAYYNYSADTWDESIAVGQTNVKASHIQELRDSLDQVLAAPVPDYADEPLLTGTPIRAAHIQQLRSRVE